MMKVHYLAFTLSAALLASCGQASTPDKSPSNATPAARALGMPIVVLQLTELQLLDADLLDATGRDIGDVEMIIRGPDGKATGLLVDVEDTNPDRYVQVPLDGLKTVRDGTGWDISSNLTRDDLLKLPEAADLPIVALGLTEMQILDAGLVNAAGQDTGEVKALVRGSDGKPARILVEVEGSGPDHHVEVPLDGLKAVRDGTGWNIVSSLSRDELAKLPAAGS
jgi:hypothetical protein